MRLAIVAAMLMTIAGSFGAAAQQGTTASYPFCSEDKGGANSAAKPSCIYHTMAQCKEAVKDDQGICIENPEFRK